MLDSNAFEELYKLDNDKFVDALYRKVLLRVPDEPGRIHTLESLKQGMSKNDITFNFLVSEEALIKGVEVRQFKINEIDAKRLLGIENDEYFVKTAYIAILGRSAEPGGLSVYLEKLRNGELDRVNVICSLKSSAEGMQNETIITGLYKSRIKRKAKQALIKTPLLGEMIRYRELTRKLKKQNDELRHDLQIANERINNTEARLNDCDNRNHNLNVSILEADRKIDDLSTKYLVDKIQEQKKHTLTTGVAYKEYEDKMRGSREEIIERLKIYDSVFRNVKQNNGDRINALDLGCGRGEWLELAENQYGVHALGVDMDSSMLVDCEKNGLRYVNANLVDYIKNAASNSVDIISLFQVAEHLEVSLLDEVLHECYRVLRRGGAIIVETPNPENMIIGACNFYFDPTHVTKLPPALLKIFVEGTGMKNAEIVRMHPYGAIKCDDSIDTDATKQLASFFNNYADYAVIAYKE